MVLAINVGNTNTYFYLFDKDSIFSDLKKFKIPTYSYYNEEDFFYVIKNYIKNMDIISSSILSSVVLSKTACISSALLKFLNIKSYIISYDEKFSVDFSTYSNTLGVDRILSCVSASYKYKSPFIVFDLGTASTVNVVDCNNKFLGGAIFPGINSMFSSILNDTDLENMYFYDKKEVSIISNNTNDAIVSGVTFSTFFTISNYIKTLKTTFNQDFKVIFTGGNAKKFYGLFNNNSYYLDETLVLEGIFIYYKEKFF